MSYEIIPLNEDHLEDAAQLVSLRYQNLHSMVPILPDKYSEIDIYLPLLHEMWSASGLGIAAFKQDRLVGFLIGWLMPSFRGKRSVYSPEWGNGAVLTDSAYIYREMYQSLSADWVSQGYIAHYISLFPNDIQSLTAWNWLGFGMISVDAIRDLDPIGGISREYHIQAAELQDVDQVFMLHENLRSYMREAPILLLSTERDRDYYKQWLLDPQKVVWLAYKGDLPVAFMRLGPADEDVCTIIQDNKTTSIYAAYTDEQVRSCGMGESLLNHALHSARKSGYERCAVSFEPMNILGTNFWLKHFQPVCYSVVRFIDQRILSNRDTFN